MINFDRGFLFYEIKYLFGEIRNTYYHCNMKAKEKRNTRSYKSTDKVYKKAMRVAKKKKEKLSQVIEKFVEDYSNDIADLESAKEAILGMYEI